ncbi:MAG: PP2C family protein-serine/threonine phosphatase [Candidatus Acidiferrum sp.]
MEAQIQTILRGSVGGIMLATVFLFVGLAACGIAAIRGRGGVRILLWFGIFNAMYGVRILAQVLAGTGVLPQLTGANRPYVIAVITYLIMIPALLSWLELSLGKLRRFLQITVIAAVVIGIAGICVAFITKSPYSFMPYNSALVIWAFLALAVVNAVPSFGRDSLLTQSRISAIGALVLAVAVLYANLRVFLHLPAHPYYEPLAFAVFDFSLGYVAAEKVLADERRLLSIESELVIAREIQRSILPRSVPALKDLRINAAYRPMTAVAGDFYEFIAVDQNRLGFLVADVSGHGVPAALIAAMVKVAMQSVVPAAHDPREVLRGLNRILTGQLQDQFVSAAYLWLDMELRKALYSAAGHPPLLCWREGKLERIESNGLLLGLVPDSDYPVCAIPLNSDDRFLLYTDGVVEPENAAGDFFGDHQLEQIVRSNRSRLPAELSEELLSGIRRWRPSSVPQQDDITLIIIDVV